MFNWLKIISIIAVLVFAGVTFMLGRVFSLIHGDLGIAIIGLYIMIGPIIFIWMWSGFVSLCGFFVAIDVLLAPRFKTDLVRVNRTAKIGVIIFSVLFGVLQIWITSVVVIFIPESIPNLIKFVLTGN